MDHKTLKQDLTYALKRFQKEGKTIVVHDENLAVVDGKYQLIGDQLEVLEALVLVKGWEPLQEHLTYVKSCQGTREVEAPLGYSQSSYLYALLEKQTGMTRLDLYAFLDGLDWVADSEYKSLPYYDVGVYIREKFQPVGTRTEPVTKKVYSSPTFDGPTKRGFVIHYSKKGTQILQVEYRDLTVMEDPGLKWSMKEGDTPPGVILQPLDILTTKDGSAPVFAGWAFHSSAEVAYEKAKKSLREGLERKCRKEHCPPPTQQEIDAEIAKIETILL